MRHPVAVGCPDRAALVRQERAERWWNLRVEAAGTNPNESSLPFARMSDLLARALRAGDLDAAGRCFAADACLITPDATAVHGLPEIRPILAQLIDAGALIQVETGSVVRVGEIALGSERLSFRSRGVPHRQTFPASTVLCRRGGAWRIAIAAPWGWGHQGCRCAESDEDRRQAGSHPRWGG